MLEKQKIVSFTDLICWQKAHRLVLAIYKLTKTFPKDEDFILISQLKRAVISISSNIAEGFGRQTYKDKVHFYYLSLGSLTEVENQVLIAKDLGYITADVEYENVVNLLTETHKLLNGLI